MAFAAVPMTWREGTLGCPMVMVSSTRTWAPSFPWSPSMPMPMPLPLPLPPLLPLLLVVVIQIAAVDMDWNPVALGTLEVPKIVVALVCWQPRPLVMARRWSARVSQSSDTAPDRVYSGTGDSE